MLHYVAKRNYFDLILTPPKYRRSSFLTARLVPLAMRSLWPASSIRVYWPEGHDSCETVVLNPVPYIVTSVTCANILQKRDLAKFVPSQVCNLQFLYTITSPFVLVAHRRTTSANLVEILPRPSACNRKDEGKACRRTWLRRWVLWETRTGQPASSATSICKGRGHSLRPPSCTLPKSPHHG